MRRAGAETLADRLVKEGRLHVDLLQRFGEDLLDVVRFLEEQGIPHRDIKPGNIAVGKVGRGDKLHLVLFDFSLSRTPLDNIRAGHHRLPGALPGPAEAATLGSPCRTVRRRGDALRAGDRLAAQVGRRQE